MPVGKRRKARLDFDANMPRNANTPRKVVAVQGSV